MAQHGAQHRGPCAQITPLTFPPCLHVEGIVALRVLSLFQGLDHSNRCAVGRQFLLHLGRQPREARKAKETIARDEAVDICLVDAVALHVYWAEDDGRLHSPDLVDALSKDFSADVMESRGHALAHELFEHLDIIQVAAVQDGGVISSTARYLEPSGFRQGTPLGASVPSRS